MVKMITNKIKMVQGRCAVVVRDFKDFAKFKRAMDSLGILQALVRKPEQNKFDYWRNLAEINKKGHERNWYSPIAFEYQIGKGFTFYGDVRKAEEWYGKENVIRASQLEDEVEDWE